MTPRSQATGRSGASEASQTHLLSLPDDLLVLCLGHLSQEER